MPRALVRMIALHLSRIWQDQKITPAFWGRGYSPSWALGMINLVCWERATCEARPHRCFGRNRR